MADTTSIPVDSDLRDTLRGLKVGGETYTETLRRILKEKEEAEAVFESLSEENEELEIENRQLRNRVEKLQARVEESDAS